MADRYEFQSPFARDGGEPWFHLGSIGVTTTVAVAASALTTFFIAAIEGSGGPVFRTLVLLTSKIEGGQLWRLVTWPLPNEPGFFPLLTIVFFYLIGQQFESLLGKRAFLGFLLAITVIPTLLAVGVSLGLNEEFGLSGIRFLFLGVVAGFPVAFPKAQGFFGIPFWVFSAVFFAIELLQLLEFRAWSYIVMLLAVGLVAIVFTRSLGFGEELQWIPAVPLPAFATGAGAQSRPTGARPARKKKQRASKNKAGLRSVSIPAASEAEIDLLLDQVSEQGIDSLTKDQKATLKRHSEAMRRRREE